MVMLDAERLARIVAPASAPAEDGGTAAQKSSQILHVEDEPGEIARLKDQVGSERRLPAGDPDRLPREVAAVGEPALLVVLAVVRQEALRDDAEEPAAGDRQRAVVEAARVPQRGSDQKDRRQIGARGGDLADGRLHGIEQRRLQVKIVDRVGGDAELGKDREVDVRGIGAPRLLEDGVAIVADVRRAHARGAGGNPDEAMPMHGHEPVGAGGVVHLGLALSRRQRPCAGRLTGPGCHNPQISAVDPTSTCRL